MAYGFTEQQFLLIEFSDGTVRRSNLFEHDGFAASYRVTVGASDLVVEQLGPKTRPVPLPVPVAMLVGSLGCAGMLVLVVLGTLLVVKAGREQPSWATSKWLFILTWVMVAALAGVGALLSVAVPLTLAVELLVAWLYAGLRKRARLNLLTATAFANVITLLPFWLTIGVINPSASMAVVALFELGIWLVEALVVFLFMRRTMRLGEALLYSLLINVLSFGLGLVLVF